MQNNFIRSDYLIFSPDDVDLNHSPMKNDLDEKTYVLGAFNPGFCRLPNGNFLLMVRVAEALQNTVKDSHAHSIRWDKDKGFLTDAWLLSDVDMADPRKFKIKGYNFPVYALTSLSWLLPVELNENATKIKKIHYDKIISPQSVSQEYGIEDPRISFIGDRYYMTVCCVSSERHSTMLYVSADGLNYESEGIILDHQNKDMLLFEGKINGLYYALTRPLGECYFATPPLSLYHPGPGIQMATSPDLQYWKPCDKHFLRARRSSLSNEKVGGGTPPILIPEGWLILYHGVENNSGAGIYRTFWAVLNKENPNEIVYLSDSLPLLESNPELTKTISEKIYLENIVFTTGIATDGDDFIIASGELDLACRITQISRNYFNAFLK